MPSAPRRANAPIGEALVPPRPRMEDACCPAGLLASVHPTPGPSPSLGGVRGFVPDTVAGPLRRDTGFPYTGQPSIFLTPYHHNMAAFSVKGKKSRDLPPGQTGGGGTGSGETFLFAPSGEEARRGRHAPEASSARSSLARWRCTKSARVTPSRVRRMASLTSSRMSRRAHPWADAPQKGTS